MAWFTRRHAWAVAVLLLGGGAAMAALGSRSGEPAPTAAPPVVTPRLRAPAAVSEPTTGAGDDELAPEEPVAVVDTGGVPEQPTRRDLETGMLKIEKQVAACHEVEQFVGLATVQLTITKAGNVQAVSVSPPLEDTATGDCLIKAVRGAAFTRFRGLLHPTVELSYSFLVRE